MRSGRWWTAATAAPSVSATQSASRFLAATPSAAKSTLNLFIKALSSPHIFRSGAKRFLTGDGLFFILMEESV